MGSDEANQLTWAALLGRWIQFARSALALPDDADGRAWRAAVPDIIGLQALALALGDLDGLPADERALACDRARLLIDRHHRGLREAFGGPVAHPSLLELLDDARTALARAQGTDGRAAGPGLS